MSRQTTINSGGSLQKTPSERMEENNSVNVFFNSSSTHSVHKATDIKEKAAREFFASKAQFLGNNQLQARDDIYSMLLRATRLPKKDVDTALKAVEHSVTLLKRLDEQKLQEDLMAKVKETIEASLTKTDLSQQLQQQMQQLRTEFNEKLEAMATNIIGTGEKIEKITSDRYQEQRAGTYAEVARTNNQASKMTPQTAAMNRQRMKAHVEVKRRQVLLINTGNEAAKKLDEQGPNEVLTYLNGILIQMGALNKGTFISITKLRDTNNYLTEMSTPTIADWLRNIGQTVQFSICTDEALKIAEKEHEIILHFVPIAFAPDDAHSIRTLEETNDLPACSITRAKWAKPVQKRAEGQRVASLLVYFGNADAANKTLLSGAIICNKRVQAEKTVREERRCFNCQRFGHIAGLCPDGDKTTCERRHCINCGTDDHASADRECPVFRQRCDALNKRAPTNLLPFFPSSEEWTWDDEPGNAPRVGPPPRVTFRTERARQRQTQLSGWGPPRGYA
ncbi:hypothetical protein GGU10DRAFT_337845, partial [Lentinula aff. detonsa]